jgi:hypothetical protein
MGNSYSAFGLTLQPSFPLPGMAPSGGEGLPSLVLDLETPEALRAAWSGSLTSTPWRGRLGDGQELTIERGIDGDLLFAYGERARFRLDAAGSRLECAPRDVARLDWQRVLLSRVIPNVGIAQGHEALHASAVETPLGVVAVAAPSGMGKSTLASELMRRGWPLFADDVLVLGRGRGVVEAQPATPHMNVSAEAADPEELGTTLGVIAGERWVAVRTASRRAREVAAVVLLERGPGLALAVRPLPGSPLDLAPYMLGLPDDDGRDAANFALYADLIDSAKLLRLTADTTDSPADLAEAVERALSLNAPFVTGGVA